jgi:hypothetical protein
MGFRMTVTRGAATLMMLAGLGAVNAALASSQAQATATVTSTVASTMSAPATAEACTKYVVISTQPVEVYIDAEPTPYNETLSSLPLGHVFCANGVNGSNTRFRINYYCHSEQSCSPTGPYDGWVTNSPLRVIEVNCTVRTLTRPATVFTVPVGDEAWMTWGSGTSFCIYGSNPAATRYQVYLYCEFPECVRPMGTYVGWVTSDPSHYVVTVPLPPSGLTATAQTATSIRLSWTDNSGNEDGFEVINGVTSQRTIANSTAMYWNVAPGTYMCFKIRSFNTAGYSAYHPSAQMDWRCLTTPPA